MMNGRPAEALRRRGDIAVAVERCLGGGIWRLGSLGAKRDERERGRNCTAVGEK
jgi:hypothetical protein